MPTTRRVRAAAFTRVGSVRTPDVEHHVARAKTLDVPVVPRRRHQMLGVDQVRALAGVPDQPDADGLPPPVHHVDGDDKGAGPTSHDAPSASATSRTVTNGVRRPERSRPNVSSPPSTTSRS